LLNFIFDFRPADGKAYHRIKKIEYFNVILPDDKTVSYRLLVRLENPSVMRKLYFLAPLFSPDWGFDIIFVFV